MLRARTPMRAGGTLSGGLAGSREDLIALLAVPLGQQRAAQAVANLEATVNDAAKKAATKVVVMGIVASAVIAYFMSK